MRWFFRMLRDDDGATAVEYAVVLALILLAVIVAIGSVGAQTGGMWGGIKTKMQTAGVQS